MKHSYCAEYNNILLRPLHRYDIEHLRRWRNKEDINRFLSPVGQISEEQQEDWFYKYIHNGDVLFFVIDYKRFRSVGTVALSDFKDDICEIGKIVIGEDMARGNNLGEISLLMAMCAGTYNLGIDKFYLTVNEENTIALHIYEKLGFEVTGSHRLPWGGTELDMTATAGVLCRRNQEIEHIMLFREDDKVKNRYVSDRGGVLGQGNYLSVTFVDDIITQGERRCT